MVIKEREFHRVAECTKCGFQIELDENKEAELAKKFKVQLAVKPEESRVQTIDISNVRSGESIVRIECPKCGNMEAYAWQMQTRSADEGATTFYRCTKCGHSWREY